MRILILVLFLASWVNPLAFSQSATEVSGLIIPRDNQGMYIRNEEGQSEITWTSKTKVALVVNNRLLSGLKGDRLTYKIHSSKEVVTFSIPKGPITGIKTTRGGKVFEIEKLKGGASHALLFKGKKEGGGKVTAKMDGKMHQAEFGYFTPNMPTSATIYFEDNGTITPY